MGFYSPWEGVGLPQRKDGKEIPKVTGDSPQDSQEPEAEGSPVGNVDARPKKTEKESAAKVAPGPSKERLKAGASRFAGGRGEVGVGMDWWGAGPRLAGCIWGGGGTGCCHVGSWLSGDQVSQVVTRRSGSFC